jgi:uncharacterized membrane protein YgcG
MGGIVRGIAGWVTVALLGLALAAGVGVAAREISSQDVGLSAEPITVGEELAPATTERRRTTTTETRERTDTAERTTTREATPPATGSVPQPEAGDDNSGSGRGRGRGRSGSGSSGSGSSGSGGGDD